MLRRRRPVHKPDANINVTSLLDIVFVLLISFMVVAPAMKHGVDMKLPQVKAANSLKQEKPLTVAVEYNAGKPNILLEGKPVALDDLSSALKSKGAEGTDGRPVTLESDQRVDWQTMAEVLNELRMGGIVNVGILTNVDKQTAKL